MNFTNTQGGTTIPAPDEGKVLQWAIQNPEAVRDAVQFLNLLISLECKVVAPSSINNPKVGIVFSAKNAILPVPLKLAAPIADSTASAASVSTQLNLLLAALRATGQLPT